MGFILGPIRLDRDVELRPSYDANWQCFSIELWKSGEYVTFHQYGPSPEAMMRRINGFLTAKGVRTLTEDERLLLFTALAAAEGGMDHAYRLLELYRLAEAAATAAEAAPWRSSTRLQYATFAQDARRLIRWAPNWDARDRVLHTSTLRRAREWGLTF